MDALFEKQDAMLRATSMKIVRGFMNQVNWSAPMLINVHIRSDIELGRGSHQSEFLPFLCSPYSTKWRL